MDTEVEAGPAPDYRRNVGRGLDGKVGSRTRTGSGDQKRSSCCGSECLLHLRPPTKSAKRAPKIPRSDFVKLLSRESPGYCKRATLTTEMASMDQGASSEAAIYPIDFYCLLSNRSKCGSFWQRLQTPIVLRF